MARRKAAEAAEPEGFVMTPMIDIVFQLLIFFVLVTDMARAQLENVVLPRASKAIKPKLEDKGTLTLNVLPDGTIKIAGKVLFRPNPLDPANQDYRRLADLFEARRQMEQYQTVKGKDDLVNYPVYIRADRSTPFQYIQLILMVASLRGGVLNVQLGATREGGEGGVE
ncbi:MAG: biopolymer transporter ExbD [Planctomycetes bacterium]|nr:biopolymer transporter ExbD [Planctomycetota bacterium]